MAAGKRRTSSSSQTCRVLSGQWARMWPRLFSRAARAARRCNSPKRAMTQAWLPTATRCSTRSARRTLDIASNRYTGGLVSYLDVVNAQQNLLNNEQELAVIQGQKLVTSVLLIKALGGGWDASSLSAVQVKSKLKDVVAP